MANILQTNSKFSHISVDNLLNSSLQTFQKSVSKTSPIQGENSQNFLGKFVRFFCNFKVLLWSSFS